ILVLRARRQPEQQRPCDYRRGRYLEMASHGEPLSLWDPASAGLILRRSATSSASAILRSKRATVGSGERGAGHARQPVSPRSLRGPPLRLDPLADLDRVGRPSGFGKDDRGAELDFPLHVLAFVIDDVEEKGEHVEWEIELGAPIIDRKSTRLNSSHLVISY